jgi:hypothetical protein
VREFHQGKHLEENISPSGYCTLELGLVKEYNMLVWFGTRSMDARLSNHVKNEFVNSLSYLFTLHTLITLLAIVFTWSNLH